MTLDPTLLFNSINKSDIVVAFVVIFCILFDVKILNIFVYVESGAGCMRVYIDGALVFVRAGCD